MPRAETKEFTASLTPEDLKAAGISVSCPPPPLSTKAKPKVVIETFTAAELDSMEIPEPAWIVPGLIPSGLTFLAGRPKVGKSWLALSLALSVAYGGYALGKVAVQSQNVLYCGLEDTKRRMQSRLKLLANGSQLPPNLILCRSIPRANDGGLIELQRLISEHTINLVIIDTWQLFRRFDNGKSGNAYSSDYQAAAEIKALADSTGTSILMIHHLKKEGDDDFVSSVSGSSGITGAADTIAVLERTRLEGVATLKITGRDVDEQALALKKDDYTNNWILEGSADEVKRSQERQDIITLLRQYSDGLLPKEIAKELSKRDGAIRTLLFKMADNGEVKRLPSGRYGAPPKEERH